MICVFPFIRCPSDTTESYQPATSVSAQRFSVKAFKFIANHPFVFVHCHVVICNTTDPASRCAKKCSAGGRGRRDLNADQVNDVYTLSQGPILLVQRKQKERDEKKLIGND